jgi:hypothetical protein
VVAMVAVVVVVVMVVVVVVVVAVMMMETCGAQEARSEGNSNENAHSFGPRHLRLLFPIIR